MRVVFVAAALLLLGCSDHPATPMASVAPPNSGAAGITDQDTEAPAGGSGGSGEQGPGGSGEQQAAAGASTSALAFAGVELPAAQLDRSYEYHFHASGAESTVEYAPLEDSLPPGLALSPAGMLSGVPSEAGEFTLKVEASAQGASVTAEFELSVVKNDWLVYRSDDRTPAVNELFAVNAGTKQPQPPVVVNHGLASGAQVARYFSWSPDGSFLAYATEGTAGGEVYVVDMRSLAPGTPVSLSAILEGQQQDCSANE